LVLAFWPHSPVELRRSLVFALLLLAGGGLVWLNGLPASRHTLAGAAIGAGLWLLVLALPRLQAVLSLAPLQPSAVVMVIVTTALTLLLVDRLSHHLSAPRPIP
jgi:Ca2+-transporting ATPase